MSISRVRPNVGFCVCNSIVSLPFGIVAFVLWPATRVLILTPFSAFTNLSQNNLGRQRMEKHCNDLCEIVFRLTNYFLLFFLVVAVWGEKKRYAWWWCGCDDDDDI